MPSLYGIAQSSRNFSDQYCWGKNQFNSSFPVALACYMRDKGIKANYLKINSNMGIYHDLIDISDVFGAADISNDRLYFSFESRYEPFRRFVHDELVPIDLVIKNAETDEYLRPIEIKLTTIPDNTTANLPEAGYGSEIVIRSATMRYMALSMANSLSSRFQEIRAIFEPSCATIRGWDNQAEIRNNMERFLSSLSTFISKFCSYEKPLLMQPIWKTIGKSASLAENCLDVFVWSDFALTKLFMDSALSNRNEGITRQERAAVRLTRFLYEISSRNVVHQAPIYDGMTFDTQNDKEFAVSGNKTHCYMSCGRLTKPIVTKNEIKNIILDGGQKWLSPERRFDAIIYFSKELFDEE
ncbi:MAG: HindVP family restriction endonuclease [bacterium]